MRFLADENVSRLVIERLRLQEFEVVSIAESASGESDPEVLQIANDQDLILITEDRDFGELVIRQGFGVRGIVPLELDRLSNLEEAERVETWITANEDKVSGNLVVLEPNRVRIRPLSPQ